MYQYQKTDNQNIRINSSTFASNWVMENNPISRGVDNLRVKVQEKKDPLGISWYLFAPPPGNDLRAAYAAYQGILFECRVALGPCLVNIIRGIIQPESDIFEGCI